MASYYSEDKTPLIRERKSVYKISSLTRKYPYDLSKDEELDKCLTIFDIISYGVGSTVGAGVFVSIGVAIKTAAGPGTLLSFLFSAIACLISAFCYSEFAAKIPLSGSAYTFAYVALGEFAGWFIGWNLTLEYAISASAVARGWSGYFSNFFTVFNTTTPEFVLGYGVDSVFNIQPLAPVIIIICTVILAFGVKDSARFNMAITSLNMITIFFFIIFGSFFIDTSNWSPFLPFGFNGVFQGCSKIFFSYVGFDSVTTLSGEVKNPKRDLPLGIVITLIIATVLYCLVSLILSGMVNYKDVSENSPLSDAFLSLTSKHPKLKWAAFAIVLGTLTSLTASTLCSLLGQPRIYMQMAKDGLFFSKFKEVNKKTQVPLFGTIFTGVFASVLALVLSIESLSNMISIGTLLAFTVVCAGIVVMRLRDENGNENHVIKSPLLLLIMFIFACLFGWASSRSWKYYYQIAFAAPMLIIIIMLSVRKQVNVPDTFKCPLSPVLPCLGVIVNTYIIMHLDVDSFYRVFVWTAIGCIIYLGYGIRNSKLNELEQDSIN
ncbi:putative cationic amino acid transporter [Heterostelium album PN500]|uniref:Putative cationic amino acid transporter n=1 Tax=Heterostelium pallidum (strain ATCC 26659 / Pp 5 / PN500) TaxID=670386 RepID=D3BED4_HETP5|nr:putative cationic amino acid transporter [Heterostelium album PN500]EFA80265.1 putative cationic amino acid transporter [Heterostelium album PN500]|eukprot:XP_020432385.1 putative cationic amino acid transporter [Heterostelium album PN500]